MSEVFPACALGAGAGLLVVCRGCWLARHSRHAREGHTHSLTHDGSQSFIQVAQVA